MAFVKGQSGNPSGARVRGKPWRDALMRAISRRASENDPQALEKIADAIVAAAISGDIQAIKEIGDRVDGKPAQAIIGGDEDDPSISMHHVIERRIVDVKG